MLGEGTIPSVKLNQHLCTTCQQKGSTMCCKVSWGTDELIKPSGQKQAEIISDWRKLSRDLNVFTLISQ